MRADTPFACAHRRMSQIVSLLTGMNGWFNPNDPGMEFSGLVAYNSSYTSMRWSMTYIPQPDFSYSGFSGPYYGVEHTTAGWAQTFDNETRYSQPGQVYPNVSYVSSFIRDYFATSLCPKVDSTVFGALSTTAITNGSTTVCVYNCGLLPWRFSRTYAAAGSSTPAVTVPSQRFSMAFSGINALDFRTNNHIAFDRDLFQYRWPTT